MTEAETEALGSVTEAFANPSEMRPHPCIPGPRGPGILVVKTSVCINNSNCFFIADRLTKQLSPSAETESWICWINLSAHFAAILVPKLRSNGDGRPPCRNNATQTATFHTQDMTYGKISPDYLLTVLLRKFHLVIYSVIFIFKFLQCFYFLHILTVMVYFIFCILCLCISVCILCVLLCFLFSIIKEQ